MLCPLRLPGTPECGFCFVLLLFHTWTSLEVNKNCNICLFDNCIILHSVAKSYLERCSQFLATTNSTTINISILLKQYFYFCGRDSPKWNLRKKYIYVLFFFFTLIESTLKLLFKKVETIFTPTSKSLKACFPTPSLRLDVNYLIFKHLMGFKIIAASGQTKLCCGNKQFQEFKTKTMHFLLVLHNLLQ